MEIHDFVTNFFNVMLVAQRKNYLIFLYKDKIKHKINFTTPKLSIPFGVELYNNKQILNLEFKDRTKNNDVNNFLIYMKQIDAYFKDMPSDAEKDNYDYRLISANTKSYLKIFYPSIKDRVIPQLRLHLTKTTEFYKLDTNGNKELLTSKDIKGKEAQCEIELSHVWVNKDSYGLLWYVKSCQIF
jgi:hypothetical protein